MPQHGYDYTRTPLWAAIYMVPMTIGFLLAAPVSGVLSDRCGSKWFTTVGMLTTAGTFVALIALPVDFNYWAFAVVLFVNGIGMGLFTSPNRAQVVNSLPADARGAIMPEPDRGSGGGCRPDFTPDHRVDPVRSVPGLQPHQTACRRASYDAPD